MVKLSISTKGKNFDKGGLKDFFKPPPSGMTPINNSGWYAGPEQVSPKNCNWYPDSPWCKSNPFENPFTESPLSLAAEPYIYECGIGVQFSGTLMWIKTRVQNFEYRFPGDCRKEPPPPPLPDLSSFPNPEKVSKTTGFDGKDKDGRAVGANDFVYCAITSQSVIHGYVSGPCYPHTPIPCVDAAFAFNAKLRCPYTDEIHTDTNGVSKKTEVVLEYQYTQSERHSKEFDCVAWHGGTIKVQGYSGSEYRKANKQGMKWRRDDVDGSIYEISTVNYKTRRIYFATSGTFKKEINTEANAPPPYERLTFPAEFKTQSTILVYGRYGFIKEYYERPIDLSVDYDPDYPEAGRFYALTCDDVLNPIYCNNELPYQRNPPPPPPDPRECCMQCCSPSQFAPQQNNDALLRQILKNTEDIKKALGVFPINSTIFDANEDKEEAQSQTIQIGSVAQGISRSIERIEKISKIIGIDVFPLKLPASLIEKVDSNVMDIVFDWFTPDEIRVNNVMSLLVYTLKYLDGVIGKWQQKIHIEDADAVKEGKQPKDIVLPDIANTLREITSVSTANHKALGLITDVCVKIITEVCNAKLDVAKTKLIVRDIQQFLSYSSRELAIEVPLSINIPDLQEVTITGNESEEERKVLEAQKKQMDALKNDLSKYLEPGTCKVVYEDWDGNKSLTDYFLHLATLIATARGQNG